MGRGHDCWGGALTAALSAEHLAGAALGWVGVQGTKVLKSLDSRAYG